MVSAGGRGPAVVDAHPTGLAPSPFLLFGWLSSILGGGDLLTASRKFSEMSQWVLVVSHFPPPPPLLKASAELPRLCDTGGVRKPGLGRFPLLFHAPLSRWGGSQSL